MNHYTRIRTFLFSLLIFILITEGNSQQNQEQLIHLLLKKQIIGQAEADSLLRAGQTSPQSVAFEKKETKTGGKVWGLAYTDIIYKAHADSARRGNVQYSGLPKDSSGLDFRRIYLGYNYVFNERFSTEFILSHESGSDALQDGNRAVFIKAANLKWKNIYPLADLIIGLTGTPTLTFVGDREGAVWAYRSIERSITDMRKLGSSSDAGLQLQGRFNKEGSIGYNLMVGNGSGTKPENDKFKKLYGEVYGKFWEKRILLDLYGDFERSRLTPYHQSKSTLKATLAFQTRWFTVGAELVQQSQENNTIYTEGKPTNPNLPGTKKDTVNALAFGYSVFASGTLIPEKLGAFIRYDFFNPDKTFSNRNFYSGTYTGNTLQNFITAGIDYTPFRDVHFIPNVWYNSYYSLGDAYNKIHDSSLGQKDYDLVYRITVYYVFNR